MVVSEQAISVELNFFDDNYLKVCRNFFRMSSVVLKIHHNMVPFHENTPSQLLFRKKIIC